MELESTIVCKLYRIRGEVETGGTVHIRVWKDVKEEVENE